MEIVQLLMNTRQSRESARRPDRLAADALVNEALDEDQRGNSEGSKSKSENGPQGPAWKWGRALYRYQGEMYHTEEISYYHIGTTEEHRGTLSVHLP